MISIAFKWRGSSAGCPGSPLYLFHIKISMLVFFFTCGDTSLKSAFGEDRWNLTLHILTLGSRQSCILKKGGKIETSMEKKLTKKKWFALWGLLFGRQFPRHAIRDCLLADPGDALGYPWNSCWGRDLDIENTSDPEPCTVHLSHP